MANESDTFNELLADVRAPALGGYGGSRAIVLLAPVGTAASGLIDRCERRGSTIYKLWHPPRTVPRSTIIAWSLMAKEISIKPYNRFIVHSSAPTVPVGLS